MDFFKLLKMEYAKYLLAAVLIIVPLFPKFPLFAVPGTYVAVRFEDLLLLVLGLVTLIKVFTNLKGFFKDEIIIAILIFFGVNSVSFMAGLFLTKTITLQLGFLNYARRLEYMVPLFAILTLFTKEQVSKNLDYFMKILIIVTLIIFVYGFGQRYAHFPLITTQNDQYSKGVALRWTPGSDITSTFAGNYDLAAFMVIMLPIFITLLFVMKGKLDKFWFFISASSGLWLLINSLSRISQISYLISVSLALLLSKKYKALAAVLVISIFLVGTTPSLTARFNRVIDVFYQKVKIVKLTSITNDFLVRAEGSTLPVLRSNLPSPTATSTPIFEDRSTSIRVNVEWPRAIRAFVINPPLGTGYSSIGLATDNDFLRMLGETGILGFLAFILIFVRVGKLFIKAVKVIGRFTLLEKGLILGMLGGIIGIFISSTFIDLFEASKFATLFWFMVGYSVYLIRNRLNEE